MPFRNQWKHLGVSLQSHSSRHGEVWFIPVAIANIFSFKEAANKLGVEYLTDKDVFRVYSNPPFDFYHKPIWLNTITDLSCVNIVEEQRTEG